MSHNFITQIRVNKVRHISGMTIDLSENEKKNLIITGKNGSGKTSLLEAIRLYSASRLKWEPGILALGDNPLKNQFGTKDDGESVFASDEEVTMSIDDTFTPPSEDEKKKRIEETAGISIEYNNLQAIREKYLAGDFILAYYTAERAYSVKSKNVTRQVLLKDMYEVGDSPGQDFVEYIKNLVIKENMYRYGTQNNREKADVYKEKLERINVILKKIYASDDIQLDFDIDSMTFRIKEPGKLPCAFDELASGYASVLYIVLDIMMRMEKKITNVYDLEGIVMIDEVDAHLHLSMQRSILHILTEMFPNIQFIVSTHSPFVLSSVSNAIVYDLVDRLRIDTEEGLSNLPYPGIVEGSKGKI